MIGGVAAGSGCPVRIMGIINTSPESFHKSSVSESRDAVSGAAVRMAGDGADYIDVGGMSTAPYLDTWISEDTEMERVVAGVRAVVESCRLPVSVDTCRSGVAAAAMDAGASILNDVTGLMHDPAMRSVISKYDPSVVLCAHDSGVHTGDAADTSAVLGGAVRRALEYGADPDKLAVDPAIGFFRNGGRGDLYTRIHGDWARRDSSVLGALRDVGGGLPVLVSVSNKSFIGQILDGRESGGRMFGSLAAEALAVAGGADIIRTHNVAESKDAAAVASSIVARLPF